MANLCIPREYRDLVRAAQDQGWELFTKRGGHPKLKAPDGYVSPIPTSFKGSGLYKTIRKRFVEHGLVFDPRKDKW